MPRPTLPPLPSPSFFSKPRLFPRRIYPQAADPMARTMPGRQIIATPELADDFVRALDVQEGEVVIECFPGHGQVTRSLLRGGRSEGTEEGWKSWEEWEREVKRQEERGEGSGSGQQKGKAKAKEVFPWTEEDLDTPNTGSKSTTARTRSSDKAGPSTPTYRAPAKVIAVEPSHTLLTRALGPADEMALLSGVTDGAASLPSAGNSADKVTNSDIEVSLHQQYFPKGEATIPINQSIHHPDLLLSNSSAYAWNTLPYILSHPLVAPQIPKRAWADTASTSPISKSSSTSAEETFDKRELARVPIAPPESRAEAANPPFTILAHIPNSTGGEQLVSQWIGSVAGSGEAGTADQRQWIWGWGRARLALVVTRTLYDRLMAKPGEAANSRLSILTSALFHRSTLPPYHHVANVDRLSARTTDTPLGFSTHRGSSKPRSKPSTLSLEPTRGAEEDGKVKRKRASRSKAAKAAVAGTADDTDSISVPHTAAQADDIASDYHYTHRPSLFAPYLRPTPPPTPIKEADFYPIAARATSSLYLPDAPTLARPHFLGIQLVPRINSPVTSEQKDAWDYVLRNCFVLQGKPLEEAVGLLGFAAEGLLDKIEVEQVQQVEQAEQAEREGEKGDGQGGEGNGSDNGSVSGKKKRKPWRGEAVSRSTLVRDLTVEQWARVVDVFDRWPFRPKNLLIDSGSSEEVHREIAVD